MIKQTFEKRLRCERTNSVFPGYQYVKAHSAHGESGFKTPWD